MEQIERNNKNILLVRGLTKSWQGVKAVNSLNLSFEQGKITSVIGPNGSGKSTLINLLSGMFPWDSGHIIVKGESLKKIHASEIKDLGITRTFQDVQLFEQMSVLDNLMLTLTKRNVYDSIFEKHSKIHSEQAKAILEKLGLASKAHELAENLSYGQRKLLELGRVMAMNSDIILLDEPFAGLFKEIIKVMVSALKELSEQGKTIILIEHNMALIRELSDYIFVMDSGRLLAEGKPEEVLSKREVIEAYLGE